VASARWAHGSVAPMDALTWLIELTVGLACLVTAWSARKGTPAMKIVGLVLLIAGLAAVGHASYAVLS
jgi:putative copper export protein